jgi:hypothetical protein
LRVALKKGVQNGHQGKSDRGRPADAEVVQQPDDVIAKDFEAIIARDAVLCPNPRRSGVMTLYPARGALDLGLPDAAVKGNP